MTFYKKALLCAALVSGSLLAPLSGYSIRANTEPAKVVQPDGSVITIQKFGDEYFHYSKSDGNVVAEGKDGYYYYADYNTGSRRISSARAGRRVSPGSNAVITRSVPEAVVRRIASGRRAEVMQSKIAAAPLLKSNRSEMRDLPSGTLVILVEFSDVRFSSASARTNFSNMLNQPSYSVNGATGSVRDYYSDNSGGRYVPSFDVTEVVTLSRSMQYYGQNDSGGNDIDPKQMVVDACNAVDAQVNFADYDFDGDGIVDNIYIFYAGYAESNPGVSENAIWPHAWTVIDKNLVKDGVRIGTYACSSELDDNAGTKMSAIGTFCHEFGHVLGLPDFYNTSGLDDAKTLKLFSLMDYGNYLNDSRTPPYLSSLERALLGWMTIPELTTAGDHSIASVNNNSAFMIETGNEGEFFVIENRQSSMHWDSYIGGSGMLIYHVDMSNNLVSGVKAIDRWYNNTLNNYPLHHCMKLMQASEGNYYTNPAIAFYPGSGSVRSFTSTGSPSAAVAWSGEDLGTELHNIALNGTNVTFRADIIFSNSVIMSEVNYGQTDVYLEWRTKDPSVTEWKVEWKKEGAGEYTQAFSEAKKYRIYNLDPSSGYTVRVSSVTGEGTFGEATVSTFTTSAKTSQYAFIEGIKSSFTVGDILPLRVSNLPGEVESIVWKLNGTVIEGEKLTLSMVGVRTLSCEIVYKGGDTEVLSRKLRIVYN